MSELLAWEFTGIAGLKRFLTQRQYEAQTPGTKRWYRPICPTCGPRTQTASLGIKPAATKHGASYRSTPTPPGASRAHET